MLCFGPYSVLKWSSCWGSRLRGNLSGIARSGVPPQILLPILPGVVQQTMDPAREAAWPPPLHSLKRGEGKKAAPEEPNPEAMRAQWGAELSLCRDRVWGGDEQPCTLHVCPPALSPQLPIHQTEGGSLGPGPHGL